MKRKLFFTLNAALQCTWGILQTILGLILFLIHFKQPHYIYQGTIVTDWQWSGGMSLGLFIFAPERLHRWVTKQQEFHKLLEHEYGHCIQSMLLGPLYLLIIGIPSFTWARCPIFKDMRKRKRISYHACYTEAWADKWGENINSFLEEGRVKPRV